MSPTARKASGRKTKAAVTEPRSELTYDEIARRAYEIHESDAGGDELENWFRAEHELVAARYPEVA
jgi:hypothetical protein